jgi:DNA/RNA endonuclease G (NUC1)
MKKLLFIPMFAGMLTAISMQPEIVIKHHNYISYYNPSTKEADSVSWDLNAPLVACDANPVDRKDAFKTDPLAPGSTSPSDYAVNSSVKTSPKYNPDRPAWIDEGHLFSYQSAMCTAFGIFECFYMTNMLPQFHAFNAGDWKTLEVQERIWARTASLHEVAGGYGVMNKDTSIYGAMAVQLFPNGHLPGGEVIPAYMWKAISTNGKPYSVWIMRNCKHSVGDRGFKTNKYNAWLTSIHTFDLVSIGKEIQRLKL